MQHKGMPSENNIKLCNHQIYKQSKAKIAFYKLQYNIELTSNFNMNFMLSYREQPYC